MTLHHPYLNLGSALQAYALCRVIRELGHDVALVDYRRPSHSRRRLTRQRFTDYSQSLPGRLWHLVDLTVEDLMGGRGIAAFVRRLTPLTPQSWRSLDDLLERPPVADVFVTGSDQVWNSVLNNGIDRVLYLDFVPHGVRRVSYGASFGLDELSTQEHETTKALLGALDAVSVREESALGILDVLGIEGSRVLDPTLLLTAREWADVSAPPVTSGPYVLAYSVEDERTAQVLATGREVADSLGVPLHQVTFGGGRRHSWAVDRTFCYSGPRQFLSLFEHALFVVCSSLHGTIFSVLYEKPFYSFSPAHGAGRVTDLLELLGLEDRLVRGRLDVDLESEPIDYGTVNQVLEQERHRSRAYLTSALSPRQAEGPSVAQRRRVRHVQSDL
jgi:hypothetical protein